VTGYVLRRAALSVGVFVVMAVLTYLGVAALPGDACTALLGRFATTEKLAQCRADNGLDAPVLQQLGDWVAGLLRGDLGYSVKRGAPVGELMAPRIRNAVLLAGVASLLAFPAAIAVGLATGRREQSKVSRTVDTAALVAMTLPEFVTASVLWLVLSVWLPILPAVTVVSSDDSIIDLLPNVWLPAITLAVLVFAHVMRSMRASVSATSQRPFADAARLRGVAEATVVRRHILPAALPPTVNVVAVTAAWLLTGTFVVEVVFNYPGLGRLAVDAIADRDTDLIVALTLLGLAVYITASFLADTVIRLLDPRVRAGVGRS
jgi:peptide/nickel transport system permease protein